MTGSVFQKRLETLRERMADAGADTLWIVQPENRRYLSGFKAGDMSLTESSGSLLINARERFLITDSRYAEEARREAGDFEIVVFRRGLLEMLLELLEGLGTRVLGFEPDYLSWRLHRDLSRGLRRLSKPVRLKPLNETVEDLREIKIRPEVRAMRAASELMARILGEVIDRLEPGRSEREIAWEIEGLAREAGAEGLAFPAIVASGPNGALPHAVPTDRRIRAREPIVMDVGLRVDGYCCDMTRTVFLDAPVPRFKKIYRTVRQAQRAGLDAIRPGVESTLPDKAARDVIREAGFGEYFGHSLGHGVGLAAHERPRLGPLKPSRLRQGMVVTVEPGIYLPGKGGVRLEEMVVIEKGGPRILTADAHVYDF